MQLPDKYWRTFLCAGVLSVLTACQTTPSAASSAVKQHDAYTSLYPEPQAQQLYALDRVNLNASPFQHAQQVNVRYLLALDADKLLTPYLREAGVDTRAPTYGNWEGSGLDGHIGGHYLTALSLAWATTGDAAISQRLDYMLDELARAQTATGGYLGGIPGSAELWAQIKNGEINADLFSLNERWVPLYNIDKIFHGLRDAYVIGKREKAKVMLSRLGEWMLDITENLSDEQIQAMLYSEHGGLNAAFADMAVILDDPRYLTLARQFTHQRIIEPLTRSKDTLTGLHANTQIPKIIGALKVAGLSDDKAWEEAAVFFWETVSQQRSVSIGGNSVREHFHDKEDFTPMVEDVEGPETCNTYNMLKLSKLLFLRSGDTRYLDFYERATYNHILSSQHPEHGGLVYFTSMRPGHYRMYSSVQDSMWCCVGSGIENHSKYGELIYTHDVDNLWVNLFISSTLQWPEKGVSVDLQTRFPDQNAVTIAISRTKPGVGDPWTMHLRQPSWLQGPLDVSVNGKRITEKTKDGYIAINRVWREGDEVTFTLDASPRVEQLPDGQDYYSVLYGPVVLATRVQAFENESLNFVADDNRMGHIAAGPVCPPEALPVILGDPERFLDSLDRQPSEDLIFTVSDHMAIGNTGDNPFDTPQSKTLIPFFRLHDSRYQIYWPQMQESEFSTFVADAKAKSEAKAELMAKTVDQITPGEQQPEVEHDFAGEATRAGVNNGMHWRDATGWFSYNLKNPDKRARLLRLTFFSGDQDRHFTVMLNNRVLANVSLPHGEPDSEFYTVDYMIPDALTNEPILQLKFVAGPDSVAGGIYGIRLMSEQ
ncbi:beta-L-arabinofuranosidase domain-containing protein [Alteromonas sp. H39]|uniref:beta-L-arabinofuranosidase domain-containing protein n=1 Tax=Alteromonas sp. H39 TaxID=3389876 RepID=UPI0039E05CA3